MIEEIKKDSFIYREIINFWKIPHDFNLKYFMFQEDDIDIIKNLEDTNDKCFYFFNSSKKKSKSSRIHYQMVPKLENVLKARNNVSNNILSLILPKTSYISFIDFDPENTLVFFEDMGKNKVLINKLTENIIIFHFDIEYILELYLLVKINPIKRPIYTYFPLNYRKIPKFLKKKYINLRNWIDKRYKKTNSLELKWLESFDIDNIRYIYISIVKLISKKEIPFISFWPNGFKSTILLSFDFDSYKSIKNLRLFNEQISQSNIKVTNFIISNKSLIIIENKIREQNSDFDMKIASHGYNHDGKLMFLSKSRLSKRINKINQNFKRKYGFRSPQLIFKFESLKEFSNNILFDSSVSTSMKDINGVRGCGTLFPYFLSSEIDICEIPITLPMEFEYQISNMNIDESFLTSKQKINQIRNYKGIISIIFHPESQLSANKKWIKYYNNLINFLIDETKNNDIKFDHYENVAEIWKFRSNLEIIKNEIKYLNDLNNNKSNVIDENQIKNFKIEYF